MEVLFDSDDVTGVADLGRAIAATERLRGARLPATHVGCRLRAKLRYRIARHLELLSTLPPRPLRPWDSDPPRRAGASCPGPTASCSSGQSAAVTVSVTHGFFDHVSQDPDRLAIASRGRGRSGAAASPAVGLSVGNHRSSV